MTLEEALAKIAELEATNKDLKKQADKADDLAEQVEAITEERDALKAKNSELIGEVRKAKRDKTGSESAAEIRQRIEAEYKDEMAELKARLDKADAEAHKAIVDKALSDALDKAGVSVAHRPAVTALLKTSRKVEVQDGKALLDGKPLGDGVAEWAKSDEGKHFIAAPSNGGSAAPGNGGSAPVGGKSRSQMTKAERGKFVRENGFDAYNKLPA